MARKELYYYSNIYIQFGVWLRLVERYIRDVEAARSNRVTPTME